MKPSNTKKRKSDPNSAPEVQTTGPLVHQQKKKSSSRNQKATFNGDAPPLGKFLASNQKETRDKAVNGLRKFLAGNVSQIEEIFETELPEEVWETIDPKSHRLDRIELAKVYQGLFYCYWMSDKPIVQQELAKELAGLNLITIPNELSEDNLLNQVFITQTSLSFWKGFWKTLELEWQCIDKHRQDKYLLLMRSFVEAAFIILQRVNWHTKAIELWSTILKETVFNVADFKTPLSITYHYSEIFLEELNRVLERKPESKAPIDILLNPLIYGLSQSRPGTASFQKIIENVFDPLFENLEYFDSNRTKILKSKTISIYNTFENSLRISSPSNHKLFISPNDSSNSRFRKVRSAILSMLFSAGADPLCSDSNRKKIYKYWNENRGSDEESNETEAAAQEREDALLEKASIEP